MQLLYPIGLFAAAAIVVPLLIHLWNVRKGKTLKVGSIAFLGVQAKESARRIRLSDWFLLLLRCLLLILLAMLIAQPRQQHRGEAPRGWVLAPQAQFDEVYRQYRPTVDSLLKAGYELHDFGGGFKKLSLADTLQQEGVATDSSRYFSLLKQLNVLLKPQQQAYLFYNKHMAKMGSEMPALAFQLKTFAIHRKDTLSEWQEDWKGKMFVGSSSPAGLTYAWKEGAESPRQILIHNEGGDREDAYLKAALAAMSGYSKRPIRVSAWSKENLNALKPDAVFWLSDRPLDPLLQEAWKPGALVFHYAQGKVQNRESFIQFNDAASENEVPVRLHKRILAKEGGTRVWTDAYGDVLLAKQEKEGLTQFVFYSRLNPQWSSLVWDEQFVKVMMPLLFGAAPDEDDFGFGRPAEDQRQVVLPSPVQLKLQGSAVASPGTGMPLNPYFWLAAVVIFALERILVWLKSPKKIT